MHPNRQTQLHWKTNKLTTILIGQISDLLELNCTSKQWTLSTDRLTQISWQTNNPHVYFYGLNTNILTKKQITIPFDQIGVLLELNCTSKQWTLSTDRLTQISWQTNNPHVYFYGLNTNILTKKTNHNSIWPDWRPSWAKLHQWTVNPINRQTNTNILTNRLTTCLFLWIKHKYLDKKTNHNSIWPDWRPTGAELHQRTLLQDRLTQISWQTNKLHIYFYRPTLICILTNKLIEILFYQIGDLLELNCTSEPSHPASHLSWEMNKVPVGEDNYIFRDTVHNGQYCIIVIHNGTSWTESHIKILYHIYNYIFSWPL